MRKNYIKEDYIDKKGRRVKIEISPSGKKILFDCDIAEVRMDKMNEIEQQLKKEELTTQEATKLLNEFGRKNKHFIHD